MTVFFADTLISFLQQHTHIKRLLVAYSGGMDSQVLLHGLVCLFQAEHNHSLAVRPLTLEAIHINHGLNSQAEHWQGFCGQYCRVHNIPLILEKAHIDRCSGDSVEEAARKARYAIFAQHINRHTLLLLAHHQDDQVETFFLRLFRGSGVRGLAAMPAKRALGQGILFRPLLQFSRGHIAAYASKQQLQWVEDDSNKDERYDRNFLRKRVLPVLAERWPAYSRTVFKTAKRCEEAQGIIMDMVELDLQNICIKDQTPNVRLLAGLTHGRRNQLLRVWLEGQTSEIPNETLLTRINRELIDSTQRCHCRLNWGKWQIRCFDDELYVIRKHHPIEKGTVYQWPVNDKAQLRLANGLLTAKKVTGQGLMIQPHQSLQVMYRQGGERCHPQQRRHSTLLKKWLQEQRVFPWEREYLPLLYINNELVAVADLCICKGHEAGKDQQGLLISWQAD